MSPGRLRRDIGHTPLGVSHVPVSLSPSPVVTVISPPAARIATSTTAPTVKRSRPGQMRLSRQRKEDGLITLSITFPQHEVADLMVEERFMAQWDSEDRAKLREAIRTGLRVWSSYE